MDTPLRIGHKGADAIAPGNTPASFRAAVEAGVDVIELDVLRPRSDFEAAQDWRCACAGPGAANAEPLLVAHDWGVVKRHGAPTLTEILDGFAEPPLDRVTIDLDVKIAGREDEIVEALRARDLIGRAMVSTMEVGSIRELRGLEPDLPVGWTVPRTTRDWPSIRWARPLVIGGMVAFRRRLPGLVRRRAPELGVSSIWAYHLVVTRALADACHASGLQLNAWTVDDAERIRELAALGVDGICTNDPRLFTAIVPDAPP